MGKIIAVVNQKGGVGKTTTSINLSASLGLLGKKVLIVDLDSQGNATTGVGIDKKDISASIYEVLTMRADIHDAIIKTKSRNLSIIPAYLNLAGVQVEFFEMERKFAEQNIKFSKVLRLKEELYKIKDDYDYILIDCPPSLGLLTVNALTSSDSVMIPIQCEFFALEGLSQLMNTIKLVKKHLNPQIDVEGVVLTMKDNRSNLIQQVSEEIRKYFGKKVYETAIPRTIRLAEAPSHGKPIFLYDPRGKGGVAYFELAKEFMKRNRDGYKNITI